MKKIIQPYGARFISRDFLLNKKRAWNEAKRRLTGEPHNLDVYLRLDDPYSYLLVQVLDSLQQRFNLTLSIYIVSEFQHDMYPALDMLKEYAFRDAKALAKLYDLIFPDNKPMLDLNDESTNLALAQQNNLAGVLEVFKRYWQAQEKDTGDIKEVLNPKLHKNLEQTLARNNERLCQQGHYLAAMIHYSGEWYWGIDRLDHLEQRLITIGCAKSSTEAVYFNRTYPLDSLIALTAPRESERINKANSTITDEMITAKALTLYWSARSPYSYLALVRSVRIAEQYGVELIIKPVLPMMMRNMFVPDTKKMYIFHDTKREAKKLGIPYGFVADPLGAAVERCYALLEYAQDSGKLNEYLLSFAYAVNSEGIRGDTDKGMKTIVERCGLNWDIARPLLQTNQWQQRVDDNLQEMLARGCWGVPSIIFGEEIFWGQDRLGLIETAINKDLNTDEE